MIDLARTDTLFGKRVNVVGNISADLVLESLGKIYIKSRNKAQTLEEIISTLATGDVQEKVSKVIITDDVTSIDNISSGQFVFDKSNKILYLLLDDELIELINVAPEGTGFVKRSGDIMSGCLTINVPGGPPLKVNSDELVKNLNVEYLNGETSESFARRAKDETITGKWRFKQPTYFEHNVYIGKDTITTGSIGTPSFVSGFGGYGWRLDSTTNTLTIDNLVVRRLLQVYELVVNKISATNGSLWVTNAGKVKSCQILPINPDIVTRDEDGLVDGNFFIYAASLTTEQKDFYDCNGNIQNPKPEVYTTAARTSMKLVQINTSKGFDTPITNISDYFNIEGENIDVNQDLVYQSLYDKDFKFDVVFPILPRSLDKNTSITNSDLLFIESYYQYFSQGDFYVVTFDDDALPVFKPGDILRCQKWTQGGIKSYDAVVCKLLSERNKDQVVQDECTYVIQTAPQLLDKKTIISYDDNLEPTIITQEESKNSTLYTTSLGGRYYDKTLLGIVEEKDSLIQIGNLWDIQRQNAVYITSTDNGAPFIDVLSGVNRPDYSVIYNIPKFKTVKLYNTSYNTNSIVGYNYLVNPPYTGTYYIQLNGSNCEYTYFEYNNTKYLSKSTILPQGATLIYYLNTYPNKYTQLEDTFEIYNLLLEDGGKIITEDGENYLACQGGVAKPIISSTCTTKARFGNLDGIQDDMFPIDKQPYGYGIYGQNVFLTGEFYLSNGRAVADIGEEAIQFAVALNDSTKASIDLLRRDLLQANNLLKQNTYTKAELSSAGMHIGLDSADNPGIVLWGNSILIATTQDELSGIVKPTALFQDGKILGKYLQVDEVHSNGLYNAEQIQFINNQATYTSCSHIMKQRINNTIYYVRKFSVGSSSLWIQVNIDGTPIINQSSLSYPSYEGLQSNNVEFDNEGFEATLDQLHLWSLDIDGKGNLGGNSFYFDNQGKVTVNGILYSKEGNIAGFALSNNSFYIKKGNMKYEPFIISGTGYGFQNTTNESINSGYASYENLPLIQMTSQLYNNSTYILDNRITISPLGIFRSLNDSFTIKTQVPEVLFTLTVIPIKTNAEEGYYILYPRLQSQTITAFSIYYKEGQYYIAISEQQLADFMAKGMLTGNLHFSVTGISRGSTNLYANSIFNDQDFTTSLYRIYNSLNPQLNLNLNMEDNDGGNRWNCRINASIEQLAFNGNTYKFNEGVLSQSFKYRYAATVRSINDHSLYYPISEPYHIEGGLTGWRVTEETEVPSSYGLIFISTGDDKDADWGGFNLTAFYYGTYVPDQIQNISVEDTNN